MPTKRPIQRAPVKQRKVVGELRREIVAGLYPPGARLPTQLELIDRFGVSGVTIQRAVDRLVLDGFLETRGRAGTFVTRRPPHLSRYGLVLPRVEGLGPGGSRFMRSLAEAAAQLNQPGEREVVVFQNVTGRENDPQYRALVSELRRQLFAGLIMTYPSGFEGTPLVDDPEVVRVIFTDQPTPRGIAVSFDLPMLVEMAAAELARLGRRRAAVLVSPPMYARLSQALRRAARKHDLELPDHWLQIVPLATPQACHNTVQLLMHREQASRPNGLIVLDDNLAEHAFAGLMAAGVSVPDELAVVAATNFTLPLPAGLPVRWVGLDSVHAMREAVRLIDAARDGQAPPRQPVMVPAMFEPAPTSPA